MNLISTDDNVVVFGSMGMAGSAIIRALKRKGYSKILKPSRKELNLLDYSAVRDWFKLAKPDVVVIAAAKVGGIIANNKSKVKLKSQISSII